MGENSFSWRSNSTILKFLEWLFQVFQELGLFLDTFLEEFIQRLAEDEVSNTVLEIACEDEEEVHEVLVTAQRVLEKGEKTAPPCVYYSTNQFLSHLTGFYRV